MYLWVFNWTTWTRGGVCEKTEKGWKRSGATGCVASVAAASNAFGSLPTKKTRQTGATRRPSSPPRRLLKWSLCGILYSWHPLRGRSQLKNDMAIEMVKRQLIGMWFLQSFHSVAEDRRWLRRFWILISWETLNIVHLYSYNNRDAESSECTYSMESLLNGFGERFTCVAHKPTLLNIVHRWMSKVARLSGYSFANILSQKYSAYNDW